VTRWEVRPERWDDALALFRDEVVPFLEKQPGFLRVLLSGDAASRRGVTLTMWRSEEDARAFERGGAAARAREPMARVFAAPPQIVGYPVLFDREF
jgi:heme-degrading monooxygenase HmoA